MQGTRSAPEAPSRVGGLAQGGPPSRRRLVLAIALGVVVILVTAVLAYVNTRGPGGGCARTPQVHPPDAIGVSITRIREHLATKYATRPRHVSPTPDGPDAYELSILDADGQHHHGDVRVQRAPAGGGWLIMTTNTCDD